MTLLSFQCNHTSSSGFRLAADFATEQPVCALFGPSGSGKTTILEMIAGLRHPDQGHIQIGERILYDSEKSVCLAPHQRRIGMVFQDHLLFPHLTVEKNLLFASAHRPGKTDILEFNRVIETLDLTNLLHRYPKNLSGGERQRTALGRALLSRPELLLLDEPLSAIDDELKNRILHYIERAVREWKVPTLLVSHSQAEVRRLADWVIVIDQGRIVTEGTPDNALSNPDPLRWRNSLGPVNLLRLEQIEKCGDHYCGTIGEQIVQLPSPPQTLNGNFYIQFPLTSVMLSSREATGISARNHFYGTVRKIIQLPEACFVAVDIGQILWAEITQDATRELALQEGSPVFCLIKTHSLKLVE